MVMLVLMMATAVMAILMMVMLVLMVTTAVMVMLQLRQRICHRALTLHGLHQLCPGQLTPRSGDQSRLRIQLPKQCHGGIQLSLRDRIGPGQDDGGGGTDLVIVELTEVLPVDLHLPSIGHRHGVAQLNIFAGDLLRRGDHIGQLAHTGRLDDHPVGVELLDHFLQSLAEITHQRTADTTGVHLGDVDTGVL